MPWPTTVGRGIASLFKKTPKPKVNRRLSTEEIAKKYPGLPRSALASYDAMLKKNYSTAFNKSRARINAMKMPSSQKDSAVAKLRTFMRNRHSEEMMRTANLGDLARQAPVTPIPDLVKQGLAFALGGGAGYGVAKNEEAIIEMLKSTKLPTGIDIETTSIGDLLGGGAGAAIGRRARGAGAGALGALLGPAAGLSLQDQAATLGEDLFPTEFDEVPEEPGLEEGSIGDLLFFNRILGD